MKSLMNLLTLNPTSATEIQQQSHFQMMAIWKAWFDLMLEEESLEPVYELTEAMLETPAQEKLAAYLKRDPGCAALMRDRYIPPAYDLDELLMLSPDSLGYEFATSIWEKGFDPNLHAGMESESDAKYVELRLSQTHDIWHVVTGFDISEIGEIGLQALHLAQFPYPMGAMLVSNSLVATTLLAPEELPRLIEAIARGFAMGKAAKPLFAQKWELGWEKPLAQWQAELNIQPVNPSVRQSGLAAVGASNR